MRTVSAMTVRRHFGGILDSVYAESETVLIERDGKPMAMLAPIPASVEAEVIRKSRLSALDRMAALSKPTDRGRDAQSWVSKERDSWAEHKS